MGRKIPGRKHRGVKDPEKQAAVKFNSIKDKINAPPTNPDDQQIPKSLLKIMELKNKAKKGEFKKSKSSVKVKDAKHMRVYPEKEIKQTFPIGSENHNVEPLIKISVNSPDAQKDTDNKVTPHRTKSKQKYVKKPEKPIPVFKQNPGESNREFLNRVNKICETVTKEAAFEDKYGVEIKRNEAGEVEKVVKRSKDELELLVKKLRKEKLAKKNKKKSALKENPRLTKSQKWQKKKAAKKLKKKSQEADDFGLHKDLVKFGEVVHAPPSLVTPKKVEKREHGSRPGQKDLLLKSMIIDKKNKTSNSIKAVKITKSLKETSKKAIDKKGKRKNLPHALRRQLDHQQKHIIGVYKQLKMKKYDPSHN